MDIYDIGNPSDPYTFKAPDLVIAATVVLLLGRGQYNAKTADGDKEVPFFMFGGLEAWFEVQGTTLEEVRETRKPELVEALRSVLIGDFDSRKLFEATNPDPDEWHDERRSSMNDIGCRAKAWADQLEAADE